MKTAILLASASMAVAADVSLARNPITDGRYGPACMDGSQYSYYWKEQTESVSDDKPRTWLIFLGGGGFCYNEASCRDYFETRAQFGLTSSSTWQDTYTLGGIFDDSQSNALSKANKVYAPMCTADAWHGSADTIDSPKQLWGYNLRGFANFYAIVKNLVETKNLGQHPGGENIVFGGLSAGAQGAMILVDELKKVIDLHKQSVGTVKILGYLDSPFTRADIGSLDGSSDNIFRSQMREAASNNIFSGGNFEGRECRTDANGGDTLENCFIADTAFKYMKTPSVVVADQSDFIELSTLIEGTPNVAFNIDGLTDLQKEYAAQYTKNFNTFVANHKFESSEGSSFRGSFLTPSCGTHTSAVTSKFSKMATAPDDRQIAMTPQVMLNAAMRSHFMDKPYTPLFCEGEVCSNNVVTVTDKCSGLKCNENYCDGMDLEEIRPDFIAAFVATVSIVVGIFLIVVLASCCCKPKTSTVKIDDSTGQSGMHTAVELVGQRADTSASIQDDQMIKPAGKGNE